MYLKDFCLYLVILLIVVYVIIIIITIVFRQDWTAIANIILVSLVLAIIITYIFIAFILGKDIGSKISGSLILICFIFTILSMIFVFCSLAQADFYGIFETAIVILLLIFILMYVFTDYPYAEKLYFE